MIGSRNRLDGGRVEPDLRPDILDRYSVLEFLADGLGECVSVVSGPDLRAEVAELLFEIDGSGFGFGLPAVAIGREIGLGFLQFGDLGLSGAELLKSLVLGCLLGTDKGLRLFQLFGEYGDCRFAHVDP